MAEKKQANGHATRGRRVSEVVMQLDERMHKEENIFLFMPNLIGECVANKENAGSRSDHVQAIRELS